MSSRSSYRRTSILMGDVHSSLFQRLTAKGIDVLIIAAVYFLGRALWLPLGVGGAVVLSAFQDAIGDGQSIGKRIIGLRVIEDYTGLTCSYSASAIRNAPLALLFLFAASPFFWFCALFLILPLFALEIYLISAIPTGIRLGDVLANTLVVEYLEAPTQEVLV